MAISKRNLSLFCFSTGFSMKYAKLINIKGISSVWTWRSKCTSSFKTSRTSSTDENLPMVSLIKGNKCMNNSWPKSCKEAINRRISTDFSSEDTSDIFLDTAWKRSSVLTACGILESSFTNFGLLNMAMIRSTFAWIPSVPGRLHCVLETYGIRRAKAGIKVVEIWVVQSRTSPTFLTNCIFCIVDNVSETRIVLAAFTKFPRRLLLSMVCEEALVRLRKLRLDRVRAVDLVKNRSCKVSNEESNPCALWRIGRQQNESISFLYSPKDINPATAAVQTFKTNDEGSRTWGFKAQNSSSHRPKSPLKVSKTIRTRRSK